jgi:hypothetical protein
MRKYWRLGVVECWMDLEIADEADPTFCSSSFLLTQKLREQLALQGFFCEQEC